MQMTPSPTATAAASILVATATTTGSACPPDLDLDGVVDANDLGRLLADWGACGKRCTSDLDDDGQVGGSDLGILFAAWGDCPEDPGTGAYDYAEALQKAITFYDAQRAGTYQGRLAWRGDAFTDPLEQENGQYAIGPGILDRYMDAGDTPTFVLPITSAMTLLAWSGIDFMDGWERAGQLDELESALRFHADWCIAAHPEPDVFCGQVGQGGPSHAFWGPPEIHEIATGYQPRIWWLDADNPGTEPAAEAAAFLAATSMLLASTDAAYAGECLAHARDLYAFANEHRGSYVDSIPDVVPFYNSWSGYLDELAWAATWLHRATGEATYLSDAENHFAAAAPDPNWAHSWDGKINGTALLLDHLTNDPLYRARIEEHLDHWLPGGGIRYTPGGLAWLDTWGSLRYAANTAFLAFAHAELNGDPDGRYRTFGEAQIDYMLGDNPRSSSYVCGFGENPPVNPHHRGAHGSWNNDIEDPAPNRHVLWGALVGGPDLSDAYVDDRGDYISNEVACDYNAGFSAAMARMAREYGGTPLPDADFPPIEDSYGREMFVEASIIEEDSTFVRIRCLLNNRSAWPARWSDGLSYRVFLDLTETIAAGFGPEDLLIESGFLDGATLGPLVAVDPSNGIHAFEVSYDGVSFGPGQGNDSVRESQVRIGLRPGLPATAWDPTNDPSISDLPFGQGAVVRTAMIAVYDDDVLVFGEEGVRDCNDNGIDDADDIADGAADLDGNGRPDECDPDCDGDGIPDAFEISNGADDCDGNGVPDACEAFADCDADGVADACAIADGTSTDCDGNGVPDQCDIADGAADDDGDGIPDECQFEGLRYEWRISDEWSGGFVAELEILNDGADPIEGWTVEWDSPYDVINVWNAVLLSGNATTSVANESFNATIPAGGGVVIGFQASGNAVPPIEVLLNGAPVSD